MAILASGYWYYRYEAARILDAEYAELAAIGDAKAGRIAQWREERMGDGVRIGKNEALSAIAALQPEALQVEPIHSKILRQFEPELDEGAHNLLLVDGETGTVLVSIEEGIDLAPESRAALETARETGTVVITNPYSHGADVHVDTIAPLPNDQGKVRFYLIHQFDAAASLFPLIASWPFPSKSAEAILVRRVDADRVQVISNRRFAQGGRFATLHAATDRGQASYQAGTGTHGRFEGVDYRGVNVIADLRPVPGSDWALVAKIDTAEVMVEARYRAVVAAILGCLVLALSAVWMIFRLRERQITIYRDLYKSERALRQAQEEYRVALYSLSDAVITTDPAGAVRRMNPAAERMTGWAEAEAMGRPVREVYQIVGDGKMQNATDVAITGSGPFDHTANGQTLFLRTRDGITRPVTQNATPVRAPDGTYIGALFVIRDQTEQHKAETELRKSEARYRTTLDNMMEGCQILDREWRFLYVNDSLVKHGRRTKAQLLGNTIFECYPGIETTPVFEVMRRCMHGTACERIENKFDYTDGTFAWFELNMHPVPEGLFVLSMDITERKASEARYRQWADAFIHCAHGVAIGNPATNRLIACNPAFAKLRGGTVEDFVDAPILSLYDQEDYERISRMIRQSDREGHVAFEVWIKRPDGVQVLLQMDLVSVRGDDGRLLYRVATALDITSQHQSKEAMHASRAMLQQILDTVPQSIFWKDRDGKYLGCNSVFAHAAGFEDPIFMVGKSDFDMHWPPELARNYREDDREVMRQGAPKSHILEPFIQSDGSRLWIDTTKLPLLDKAGEVRGVLGVFEDVTHRVQAEEALRQSEERFRRALENIPDVIVIYDRDLRYRYINSAVTRVTGRQPEDLLGHTNEEIWPEHVFSTYLPDLRRAKEQRATQALDVRVSFREGDERALQITFVPLLDEAGEVREILTIAHDYTDRHRAADRHVKLEAQLLQAQKMEAVGRLAGGVAHDFNNMLAVITGNAGLAIDRVKPDDPIHQDLQEVLKASERSAELTRQLLAFARRQPISLRELNVNDTIAGMLKMLGRLIGENIELVWKPSETPVYVNMDPTQIDQILANLVVNARDAIDNVGCIVIETDLVELDEVYCGGQQGLQPGSYVSISVSDDGSGMSKEVQARLFEPFFTTKPQGKGTGLGLAMVYGIAKQNAGSVSVYSEEGQGTTIRIYLPYVRGEVAPVIEHAPTAIQSGTETILLVEDELALLNLGKRLLTQLGYTVLAAETPAEALRIVSGDGVHIDLLMTDVIMPGMSGRDLWRKVREVRPDAKCLFMSGYTADVIAHQGILEDGIHFLQKPFNKAGLAEKLREALAD